MSSQGVSKRPRKSLFEAVSMEKANELLLEVAKQLPLEIETLKVGHKILGKILVKEITASENLPAARTSIKDGYARLSSDDTKICEVVGESTAGSFYNEPLTHGQCIRISTGAVVPDAADTVIEVEETEIHSEENGVEKTVIINLQGAPGKDIRQPGSDVKKGDVLLRTGQSIGSAELGLLVSFGIEQVQVYKKPEISVVSSGNELVDSGVRPLPLGFVRDSNGPQLVALLMEHGYKAINAGRMGDDPSEIEAKIRECAKKTRIIVTSGGVSMGEKDYMKNVLKEQLGFEIHFGRVWMKPGLPCTLASGQIDSKSIVVVALPGNPVSATVCPHLFVIPLCRAVSGFSTIFAQKMRVKLATSIKLGIRPEYCRAVLEYVPGCDVPVAHITGQQQSSRLMSMCGAEVLLELPDVRTTSSMEAGTVVNALSMLPNHRM